MYIFERINYFIYLFIIKNVKGDNEETGLGGMQGHRQMDVVVTSGYPLQPPLWNLTFIVHFRIFDDWKGHSSNE